VRDSRRKGKIPENEALFRRGRPVACVRGHWVIANESEKELWRCKKKTREEREKRESWWGCMEKRTGGSNEIKKQEADS